MLAVDMQDTNNTLIGKLINKRCRIVTYISLGSNQESKFNFFLWHIDKGGVIDIIYLDFSEAFATVSHDISFRQLVIHSLAHSAVKWVKSCNQRGAISDFLSSWEHLSSSVHL